MSVIWPLIEPVIPYLSRRGPQSPGPHLPAHRPPVNHYQPFINLPTITDPLPVVLRSAFGFIWLCCLLDMLPTAALNQVDVILEFKHHQPETLQKNKKSEERSGRSSNNISYMLSNGGWRVFGNLFNRSAFTSYTFKKVQGIFWASTRLFSRHETEMWFDSRIIFFR